MNHMRVTNSEGRTFNVIHTLAGEKLTLGYNREDIVEFHDATFEADDRFPELGQFTGGRYYASTILAGESGLIIHGGVPEWTIDPTGMARVREWLRGAVEA